MASTTTTTASGADSMAPAAARHLDEYRRLALLLNRHISDLGAASGAAAVSRVLVEADLAFAEAEGEVRACVVYLGAAWLRSLNRGLKIN